MYQTLSALSEPFSVLYLLVAAGLAMLWWRRVESRRRLLAVTVPFIVVGIISTPAVAYFAIGSLEWRYAPETDLPKDGEAIVVLAGEVRPPDARVAEVEMADATLLRCLRGPALSWQALLGRALWRESGHQHSGAHIRTDHA